MREKIYTIPVNEAFDLADGCPICRLYKKLEENELEIILGASMMEPDVRIKTNHAGFCGTHFDMMFKAGNRLGLALILESHLAQIAADIAPPSVPFSKDNGQKTVQALDKLDKSCYICDRISYSLSRMASTCVLLWDEEEEFRQKLSAQPMFCLPHYAGLLRVASAELPKKRVVEFVSAMRGVMDTYLAKVSGDVSWFIKKFDYNYQDEPWYDSKDAVERALKMIIANRK
ncbi:MAG: DUF6062 family protein [Eubacteriales bacterium]